jgi:hypothetical protein
MRAHNPGKATFVGNGYRAVAQFGSALDQLLRMRCAAQEGEIADAMQLCVVSAGIVNPGIVSRRDHADTTVARR